MTILQSQSNQKYTLLKDSKTNIYYIKRNKDRKKAVIGNRDDAELYILYGINDNKEDLKQLNFIL